MLCSVSVRLCASDDKRNLGFGKGIVMLLDGIGLVSGVGAANTTCEDVAFDIIPKEIRKKLKF